LSGLREQDQRRCIGRLSGEREVEQDERVRVPAEAEGERVERDPSHNDERLADDVLRRAEEPRCSFGRAPERVLAEGAVVLGSHRSRLRLRADVIALVDGENVRRSLWPNLSPERLVDLLAKWAEAEGIEAVAVFDGAAPEAVAGIEVVGTGRASADDWIAVRAAELDEPYLLVTSDRELRERAGGRAEQVIGGGTLARELQALEPESPSA
jgi:hypothetical protein